jgi:D-arabinose 1-dehydrogenase-like Zn-dependent alcohol dehydrogenase
VVIHAPGAPEQLVVADVPEPEPGRGDVLIDVAYAGCNWALRYLKSRQAAGKLVLAIGT